MLFTGARPELSQINHTVGAAADTSMLTAAERRILLQQRISRLSSTITPAHPLIAPPAAHTRRRCPCGAFALAATTVLRAARTVCSTVLQAAVLPLRLQPDHGATGNRAPDPPGRGAARFAACR